MPKDFILYALFGGHFLWELAQQEVVKICQL